MARNTSVSLGTHFVAFVDRQVDSGRFGSASEVVRAGLRLLEEHEASVQALTLALVEGEQSGAAEAFEIEEFLQTKRQSAI